MASDIEMLAERASRVGTREEARKILNSIRRAKDFANEPLTDFVLACMKNSHTDLLRAAAYTVRKITWTESEKCHLAILDQFYLESNSRLFDRSDPSRSSSVDALLKGFAKLARAFRRSLKLVTPSQYFTTKVVQLFTGPFSPKYSEYYAAVCSGLINCVNWQIADPNVKHDLGQVLRKFFETHIDLRYYETEDKKLYFKHLLNKIWPQYIEGILLDERHEKCLAVAVSLSDFVSRHCPLADDGDRPTFFGNVVWYSLEYFYKNLSSPNAQLLKRFVPICWYWHEMLEYQLSKTEKTLKSQAERCLRRAIQQRPMILGDLFTVMCESYFLQPDLPLLSSIQIAYLNAKDQPQIRSRIEQLLPRFLRAAQLTPDANEKIVIGHLASEISKANPSALSPYIGSVESLVDYQETCAIGLNILKGMAKYLRGYGDSYFTRVRIAIGDNNSQHLVVETLKAIALQSEAECERVVSRIEQELERQTIEDQKVSDSFLQAVATSFSELVMKYRSPFDRRRILLERLKILYPLISLPIRSVIDFLDGRLAADFDKASSVDRTGSTLSSSPHTEELESTLHLVSRPPPWCQDVCALLNKKTSNNWKTVAQRLAYSSNEIRMWAAQHNPCAWLLNDFYAVNKGSEATRQLLRVLNDLKRFDVIAVIDDYQRTSNEPSSKTEHFGSSPTMVFISYEPTQEQRARSLKRRLENEGYVCLPMETGRKHASSVPLQKLDDMIRSSSVVVAFVTERYCRSPECIHQANYATAVEKPIIPLTLEKQLPWPPPGHLSGVLDSKAMVKFYERNGENWPPSEQYNQLLSKLAIVARPQRSKKPIDFHDSAQTVAPVGAAPPNGAPRRRIVFAQVCLSCTPDKQYSMESLKRSLDSRGYACQICTFGPGGMDECGADIVLCALSARYGLSSSAQRTVDQAERYQKVLIPLLLDDIPYPPDGPTKPTFARLAPVDCRDMLTHLSWEGERQLSEILSRLTTYLQPVQSSSFRFSNNRNQVRLPQSKTSMWHHRPASPPPPASGLGGPVQYNPAKKTVVPILAWEAPDGTNRQTGYYGNGSSDEEDEEDVYYDELDFEDEEGEPYDEYDENGRNRPRPAQHYENEIESDEEYPDDDISSSEDERLAHTVPYARARSKFPTISNGQRNGPHYYPHAYAGSNMHRSYSMDDVGDYGHARATRTQPRSNFPPSIAAHRRNISPLTDGKRRKATDDYDVDRAGMKLPSLYSYRQKLRHT